MPPKFTVRSKRYELEGDYEGFWIEIRTNPPMRVYEEFSSGVMSQLYGALALMTLASNMVDEHDAPVDLTTVEGWRSMPKDLLEQTADRIITSMTVPKTSGNGSQTRSLPEPEPSPATTI